MTKSIPNKEFLHSILIYGKNTITIRQCKKTFEYFKRGHYVFEYDDGNRTKAGTSKELSEREELEIMIEFMMVNERSIDKEISF